MQETEQLFEERKSTIMMNRKPFAAPTPMHGALNIVCESFLRRSATVVVTMHT